MSSSVTRSPEWQVHAPPACVASVQGRPGPSGGTYDQAQQPLLILAGGLHAARN